MLKYRLFICVIFALGSCSPARFVKPLAKRQHAVSLSLGGPLFKYGNATIPMPFLSGTYGYGIDSLITGFLSLNITSALYGNLQLEPGITWQVSKQYHYLPAISISPVVTILYRNKSAFKLYPQFDLNAFWEYGKRKNYFYFGINNWFELAQKRSLEQKQPRNWICSPHAGYSFNGRRWNLNLEIKIIAPHVSNEKLVVDYQTPLKNNGAFGTYVSYTRKF